MSFPFTKREGNAMISAGKGVIWVVSGRVLPHFQLTRVEEAAHALSGSNSAQGLRMCLIINTGD